MTSARHGRPGSGKLGTALQHARQAKHRLTPSQPLTAGTGSTGTGSKDLLPLTAEEEMHASGVYSPVHRTSDIRAEDFGDRQPVS